MSRKYSILVVNGPNLRHLGVRQPEIYGRQTMDALPGCLGSIMPKDRRSRVSLNCFQDNSEGALINRLEAARLESCDGIVLNAGAYTHTSLALADCLAWIDIPTVEVHLSSIFGRPESLRHSSLIAPYCIGIIAGFNIMSYALAVQALFEYLESRS